MKKKTISIRHLIVVIFILAIVSVVIFKGRNKGGELVEARQLRQIYTAAMLYKADNNDNFPESLVTLRTANYLPTQALTNPVDPRRGLNLPDWPANPWMLSPFFGDPPRITNARYGELNSYAFLPTWKNRYHHKTPWDEFIQEPNRGLITGLGLMKCQTILGFPSCNYYVGNPKPDRLIDSGQPPTNLIGTYMTIRIDGKLVTRHRPPPVSGTMSLEGLFFLNDSKAVTSHPMPSSGFPSKAPGR